MHFLLINSRWFSWSATFSWFNWEQYLLELIVWFRRSSEQRTPNLTKCTSPSLEGSLAFGVVGGGSFCLPHESLPFHIIVQYPFFFACQNLFLKWNIFCYISVPFPFHFSLSCIGEGNGNPLQCSCLENSRDGGAWWAAIYGVAQSRTRLTRLSSSSSRELQVEIWSRRFFC